MSLYSLHYVIDTMLPIKFYMLVIWSTDKIDRLLIALVCLLNTHTHTRIWVCSIGRLIQKRKQTINEPIQIHMHKMLWCTDCIDPFYWCWTHNKHIKSLVNMQTMPYAYTKKTYRYVWALMKKPHCVISPFCMPIVVNGHLIFIVIENDGEIKCRKWHKRLKTRMIEEYIIYMYLIGFNNAFTK